MVENQHDSRDPKDRLMFQVEETYRMILSLLDRSDFPRDEVANLVASVIEEMRISLEELRVSEEELIQQNEELQDVQSALESERRYYQSLFEAAPIGYIVTNSEGIIQEANRVASQLLNVRAVHLIGKPLSIFVPAEHRPAFRYQLIEFLNCKKAMTWETYFQGRDSTELRMIEVMVVPAEQIYNPDEKLKLRWLLHDVTISRQAEAARINHFFRESFEQAAVGIAHVNNPDGRLLRVNQKLCDMLGYTHEELLGLSPQAITHPEDVIASARLNRKLLSGEIMSAVAEKRFIRKNGSVMWAEVSLSGVRDASGQYEYTINVINDITERKRIIAAEREQRVLAEALRDTAQILASSLDFEEVLDHILSAVNRIVAHEAATILLAEADGPHIVMGRGYNPAALPALEKLLCNIRTPGKRENIFDQMSATRQPLIISDWEDNPARNQAGEFAAIRSLICVPVIARDEVIGYLVLHSSVPRDFTQRDGDRLHVFAAQSAVAIQNARAHQQAQLLAAYEERQRLARDLHDAVTQSLFTSSIISEALVRLGQKRHYPLMPRIEELHRLNRGALAEMRNLFMELRPELLLKMDLPAQIHQLAEAVQGRMNISIKVDVQGEKQIPPQVQIAFYRILQESLNNIVKHSGATRVEIRLDRAEDAASLFIGDNGRGYDPAKEYSGIGMVSMRERSEAIRAALQVTSAPGAGTKIFVEWHNNRGK